MEGKEIWMMMKVMRNIGLLVVLFSMSVLATGCVEVNMITGGIEYKEYDEMIFAAKDRFYLDNFNGRVIVLPSSDGQVKVQYSKVLRGNTEEYLAELAKKITIESQEDSGYVKLNTSQPYPRPSRSKVYSMWIEFQIFVPADTQVQIITRNSSIEVQGMRESLSVETTNGEIRIEDLMGDLEADTTNGKINVRDIEGNVDLGTTNGQIYVREIEGNVDLDTSNGQIIMEAVKGQVRADSTNGRICVDKNSVIYGAELDTSNSKIQFEGQMIQGYDYNMDTSNGRVEVWIDTTLGYNLAAKTSNGQIRFTFPYAFQGSKQKTSMHGQLFGGGIELELKNSNGDIVFYEWEG